MDIPNHSNAHRPFNTALVCALLVAGAFGLAHFYPKQAHARPVPSHQADAAAGVHAQAGASSADIEAYRLQPVWSVDDVRSTF